MRWITDELKQLDWRVVSTLLLSAAMLLLVHFRGSAMYWEQQVWVQERWPVHIERQFACEMLWAASTITFFGIIPFLFALVVLRLKPRDLGFSARGFLKHLPIYVGFMVVMFPVVWWASKRPDFLETYPFARLALSSDEHFWKWEVAYFLQFVALEFFFRGFLIFVLERRFGMHAVFVMVVPYAMIHWFKPMPEAFGAIVAGTVLGFVALKTRSFYGGILIHYAVALTMDVMARAEAAS